MLRACADNRFMPLSFLAAVGGLLTGSFLNVVAYRLPRGESLVSPGSHCQSCNTPVKPYDNIPVIGWLMLLGRCRSCRERISIRYPIVEALTSAMFLLHWYVFGPTPLLFVRLAFACALIVLFAIDLEHQILPNVITVPGIVVGLICSLFLPPGLLMSLAGFAVGGGLLWAIAEGWYRLRKVEAMGFGDVKMLAMVGAFLGVKLVFLTFVLSSMIGGLVAVVLVALRRADMATKVPFGTMLAVGALVASLYGDRLVAWYLAGL